jgi:hypothetical protein
MALAVMAAATRPRRRGTCRRVRRRRSRGWELLTTARRAACWAGMQAV